MGLNSDAILTPAETRIAVGYAEGLIGKEIAQRAGISYNTVVRHTQNIYEKTGIRRSTNALVAWFLSLNYGIDMSELRRRIGSACLLALFCFHLAMGADDDMMCRRARRTRRRNESELLTEI